MITLDAVKAALATVPPWLQEYVKSDELFDTFHEIRIKHRLHLDKAGELELVLYAVVVGLHQFSEMQGLIRDALRDTPTNIQDAILNDFNEEIFKPLREKTRQQVGSAGKGVVGNTVIQKKPQNPPILPAANLVSRGAGGSQTQTMIVEQKLLPAQQENRPRPEPPRAPPRYHGADPYRELAE